MVRSEGDPPTGDVTVDEAYDALGITYNFFSDVYGRDSIDNSGMQLEAVVHFGRGWNNAAWNGHQLMLGDGDGKIFRRFTITVDIKRKP